MRCTARAAWPLRAVWSGQQQAIQNLHKLHSACTTTCYRRFSSDAAAAAPTILSPSPHRTHTCAQVGLGSENEPVTLIGWLQAVRSMGGFVFLVLRDAHGLAQCLVDKTLDEALHNSSLRIPLESVIKIKGVVRRRPEKGTREAGTASSGQVEVHVEGIEVTGKFAASTATIASSKAQVSEDARLEHRFLDLRRPEMQHNLKLRSKIAHTCRQALVDLSFTEVETPTLFKSTPEGAREFLVPTRTPGRFYALPQSPQQFKQMLMVGGVERYFQIARCYRDEGMRADRQPEFTQVDLEMAFGSQRQIQEVIESVIRRVWAVCGQEIPEGSFHRRTYADVMSRYGSDKPDTRLGMEIHNLTPIFANTAIRFLAPMSSEHGVYGLCARGLGHMCKGKGLTRLQEEATKGGAGGVYAIGVDDKAQWQPASTAHLTAAERHGITDTLKAQAGDLVLLCAGGPSSLTTLGRLRIFCGNEIKNSKQVPNTTTMPPWDIFWVEGFPMFEKDPENPSKLSACHHPFVAPVAESLPLFHSDPLKMVSQAYDLVINGFEVGGGSIRIHDPDMQRAVFKHHLGMTDDQIEARFGHLLLALSSGCPPHGGIALGLDRLVMLLCGASNLRDVLAFPKTASGNCLLTRSPSTPTDQQLSEYHIRIVTPSS